MSYDKIRDCAHRVNLSILSLLDKLKRVQSEPKELPFY